MASHYGGIPEDVIQEIIARNSIESVVGKYVQFTKRTGQNQFGLCPFHSEDTPSFSISTTKQIYYCFGCHKGGNVIHFLMEIENIGYVDAIKLLAEQSGVTIPESNDEEYQREEKKRKRIKGALLEAARYFYANLMSPRGEGARSYLQKRAISTKMARGFGLGYAPDEWEGLSHFLKDKGYRDEELLESGLFTKGKRGQPVDLFRGRLMFPIFNPMGEIIAFGGRIMGDGQPKYINSPESPVYSKQKNLYALNFAKASCKKQLIIVEGYMDVISMHQAGVKNAVASLGTALTERHLDLLGRYTEEVVLFYDSDKAGQNAAIRGLKMIMHRKQKQSGLALKVSVAKVPNGKDPDEFIREFGAGAFQEVVDSAMPVMDYLMDSAKLQCTNGKKFDAQSYQMLVCEYLSWETNLISRERAANLVSSVLGVSTQSILNQVALAGKERKASEVISVERKTRTQTEVKSTHNLGETATNDELILLVLLSMMGSSYSNLFDKPLVTDFSMGTMRSIAKEYLPLLGTPEGDTNHLLEATHEYVINKRLARDVISECLMTTTGAHDEKTLLRYALDYLYRVRMDVYTRQKKRLAEQLDGMPNGPDKEATKKGLLDTMNYLKYLQEQMKSMR